MASIIKVEHLSYVYNPGMPNAVTALDDVSFEVEAVSYTHLDVYKRQVYSYKKVRTCFCMCLTLY